MKGGSVWPALLTFTICTKTASKVSEQIDAETSEEISSDTQRDAGIEREGDGEGNVCRSTYTCTWARIRSSRNSPTSNRDPCDSGLWRKTSRQPER